MGGGQRVKVSTSKGSKQYNAIVVGSAKRSGEFVLRIREGHPRQMTPEMQMELSRLKAEADRYWNRYLQTKNDSDLYRVWELDEMLHQIKPPKTIVKTNVKAMPIEIISVKPPRKFGTFVPVPRVARRKSRIATIRKETEKKYSGKRAIRELKKRGIRPKANRKGKPKKIEFQF